MDFSQLKRPTRNAKPLDPINIFERRPSLPNTPNDLWRGQTEALNKWHKNRTASDVLIALNTGAGKTLVGLLIAQSLVNEGVENVIYLCGTNDLVHQTYREAEKFRGTIDCTLRTSGRFSNSLFETGKGFCITNYASLFNGFSALIRNHFPGAVIFDDAHVAERMIRESFTLKISSSSHSDLFGEIIVLFESHFREVGKYPSFKDIIENPFHPSIMASPSAVRERSERLYTLLSDSGIRDDENLKYSFNHLKDNLVHCSIVFDCGALEIAPPFLPLFSLPVFSRDVRRLYLSASLNYKSDIARAFGRIPNLCIEPKNDAGNGERLVLFAQELSKKQVDSEFVEFLSKKHKVLIAVPSSRQADTWKALGTPPASDNFSEKLQEFREASSGTFILVSRVDGIDLPQETCRIMVLDELPKGASLLEQFQWDVLDMINFRAAKLSNQIIQLFGRINRGRNDYGVFIINGKTLSNWLSTDRKLAFLPELLRKQIRLGAHLHRQKDLSLKSEFCGVIDSVLSRDPSWIDFYGESIDEMDLDAEDTERTQQIEERMANAALAEVKFMSSVWVRDYETARQAIETVIQDTARADTKLSGWHNLWLGMCLESEQDYEAAQEEYSRAQRRLGSQIIISKVLSGDTPNTLTAMSSMTDFEQQIDSIVGRNSPERYKKYLQRLRTDMAGLDDFNASVPQQEEALRALGEYLGFASTRPDNDCGTGPDVFWVDEDSQKCIAFELKTDKKLNPTYFKKDIEQGHDHIQWIRQKYPSYFYLGLVYVGLDGKRAKAANPSSEMYLCDLSILAAIKNQFIAGIEDLRTVIPSIRLSKVVKFCSESQWKIEGFALKVKAKSILSLEVVS
jgi:tetratricopeptide (TPR) repeat protein